MATIKPNPDFDGEELAKVFVVIVCVCVCVCKGREGRAQQDNVHVCMGEGDKQWPLCCLTSLQGLRKAMKGFGTDEKKIIQVCVWCVWGVCGV